MVQDARPADEAAQATVTMVKVGREEMLTEWAAAMREKVGRIITTTPDDGSPSVRSRVVSVSDLKLTTFAGALRGELEIGLAPP